MILIFSFILTISATFANYNIGGYTKDGVFFTSNKEPSKDCIKKGSFTITSSSSAKDEEVLIREVKNLGGNFLFEKSVSGFYSREQGGDVFFCPKG